jgi:hypothetical protein
MQTDLFPAPAAPSSAPFPLIGLIVDLSQDRAGRRCCNAFARIHVGKGPHAGELRCTGCGKHVNWISKPTADWIAEVIRIFGRPTTPIVIRTPVRP